MFIFLIGSILTGLLMLVHFFMPGAISNAAIVLSPLTFAVSILILQRITNAIKGVFFHFKAKKIMRELEKPVIRK